MQYSPCEEKKKKKLEVKICYTFFFFFLTSKNMFNIFKVNLTMDFQR